MNPEFYIIIEEQNEDTWRELERRGPFLENPDAQRQCASANLEIAKSGASKYKRARVEQAGKNYL